ncbi:hypothetical protein GW534_08425 [Bacillus sp. P1(2020)]|uniref:Uncharacterized protein n=1 Tax=Pallidibacillus pasinlerensis TaxID=2703818 RepID=A0ABX0A2W0_9BACI|nr:hypothetical protein [Pallidibacillus pasinlerensis]
MYIILLVTKSELNRKALAALVEMTPLTWGIDENQIDKFLQKESAEITVDVDILIGR